MIGTASAIDQRIKKLKAHLERENPVLLEIVKSFRQLDKVAHGLGILGREESFATRVPWWPMVAVLGTFSSGKSTFINHYLGQKLQLTGNQAVDDKFTVICYAGDDATRTLPGLALDADPRFPFYQMSHDIEAVSAGEGQRVDAYLQLKTCRSEALRGKIFIDSPGFDADEQRNTTLRITDHIITLSDLVLVFFDARHPEPGAMHDTLEHLVASTIKRPDSSKFLFILNQIDNAAREDNPEEVFGAWQRALAQKGLTAGRFYSIYDPDAAIPIADPKLKQRFESKRAEDVAEIHTRIEQVEVERAYRIIGVLEQTAKAIENRAVPALREARERWKRRIAWLDGLVLFAVVAGLAAWSISAGYWEGLRFTPPWGDALLDNRWILGIAAGGIAAIAAYVHFSLRRIAAQSVAAGLRRDPALADISEWVVRGFAHGTRPWRSSLSAEPAGWTHGARRRIAKVLADADGYVQMLNNRFADPSGSANGRKRRKVDVLRPAPATDQAVAKPAGNPHLGSEETTLRRETHTDLDGAPRDAVVKSLR